MELRPLVTIRFDSANVDPPRLVESISIAISIAAESESSITAECESAAKTECLTEALLNRRRSCGDRLNLLNRSGLVGLQHETRKEHTRGKRHEQDTCERSATNTSDTDSSACCAPPPDVGTDRLNDRLCREMLLLNNRLRHVELLYDRLRICDRLLLLYDLLDDRLDVMLLLLDDRSRDELLDVRLNVRHLSTIPAATMTTLHFEAIEIVIDVLTDDDRHEQDRTQEESSATHLGRGGRDSAGGS
jgi:hypothetical protein